MVIDLLLKTKSSPRWREEKWLYLSLVKSINCMPMCISQPVSNGWENYPWVMFNGLKKGFTVSISHLSQEVLKGFEAPEQTLTLHHSSTFLNHYGGKTITRKYLLSALQFRKRFSPVLWVHVGENYWGVAKAALFACGECNYSIR